MTNDAKTDDKLSEDGSKLAPLNMSMTPKSLSLILSSSSPTQGKGETKVQKELRKKEKDYQKALFDMYVDIETTKLVNESKRVDLAETLYIYSKN